MQLGFSSDYDVSGVTDPFLQVKFLSLLRILAKGDRESSELINDVLAQVAASTEVGKNVGIAILYETVRTIMDIEADNSLRVLAINMLGRFLVHRDNNVRYIALNLLSKAVHIDIHAVQRHRNIIVDCLKDCDISIRRRALELIYSLMNESNVCGLVRELLIFLEVADNEFKPNLTMQIGIASEKYAPNKRWHFDVLLRVLKLAGAFVREEILSSFIFLISSSPELHTYMVRKLYFALKQNGMQEALVHAASWSIGEYGDLLIGTAAIMTNQEEEEVNSDIDPSLLTFISQEDVLSMLETLINGPFTSIISQQYILTALVKLGTRFPKYVDRIVKLMEPYCKSQLLELQQRAVEYSYMIRREDLRLLLFERMPVAENTRILSLKQASSSVKAVETLNLLDLDLSSDLSSAPSMMEPPKPSVHMNLLADLFGSGLVTNQLDAVNTSLSYMPDSKPYPLSSQETTILISASKKSRICKSFSILYC
jgi:AP-1 complex subunit gamma-1